MNSTEEEIIDMLHLAFPLAERPKPSDTLGELGLDSLEAVEVHMLLEDRWGEDKIRGYEPGLDVRIEEMAAEVERRIA